MEITVNVTPEAETDKSALRWMVSSSANTNSAAGLILTLLAFQSSSSSSLSSAEASDNTETLDDGKMSLQDRRGRGRANIRAASEFSWF